MSDASIYMLFFSRQVMSNSLQPHRLQPARFLHPWDFPAKNTGVRCHFLSQGIFLLQELNLYLLQRQVDSLPLGHQGSPHIYVFISHKQAQLGLHNVSVRIKLTIRDSLMYVCLRFSSLIWKYYKLLNSTGKVDLNMFQCFANVRVLHVGKIGSHHYGLKIAKPKCTII